MVKLTDPIGFLSGITPTLRKRFESLELRTVDDLVRTVPRRYDDYSQTVLVRDVRPETVCTLRVRVVSCKVVPSFRKRMKMVRVKFEDASGAVHATFFHQPWLIEQLPPGREVLVSGKVKVHERYGVTFANPLWEPVGAEAIAAGKIAPVYGLTGSLTQKAYRAFVQKALKEIEWPVDPLSDVWRERFHLLSLTDAFQRVHVPETLREAETGRRRLAFDELLTFQLALQTLRAVSERKGAPAIPFDESFAKRFVQLLPFPLTDDQKKVAWACFQDMKTEKPMRRLLQGDVGCGKTVVAAFLAAHVQRAGSSVVILAPTDVLAKQHAESFRTFFAAHHIPIICVTRGEKSRSFDREQETLDGSGLAQATEEGNAVFIGTHALLEPGRLPKDVALAIVDEQHRFGVEQRELLVAPERPDGRTPHLLSMTATPIPRSLSLTWYGDLDLSIIRQKPQGKKVISTKICVGEERDIAYTAVREAVKRGEQAFIVCPLIDPSDALGVRSAMEELKRLSSGPLRGIRLGLVHGRLKPVEKDAVMRSFLAKELDVLIATSVIEVGIDVPNATVIAIEGAERFGLAQLHQLRGRVGRATLPGTCYLLTDAPTDGQTRLRLLETYDDGLMLAEADLRLRGTGNLLGIEQSGRSGFRAVRLRDTDLIEHARTCARDMIAEDPELERYAFWKERAVGVRQTAHAE